MSQIQTAVAAPSLWPHLFAAIQPADGAADGGPASEPGERPKGWQTEAKEGKR